MTPLWSSASAAAALLAAAAPAPAQAPRAAAMPQEPALAEGRVISSDHDVRVAGWRRLWGGDYVRRSYEGNRASEVPVCCITVMGKGSAYMVLKTQPVTRGTMNEPLSERIQRRLWITHRPGEQTADCQILWINTALSLVDTKTGNVRSVVVDGEELVLFEWKGGDRHCAFGD